MQMPFTAVPVKKLSNIIAISACAGHMLALERDDQEPLASWSSAKVFDWFHAIGFGDCANVVKYSKITGAVIEGADDDFLADTLGIMQEVERDKFRFELGRVLSRQIGTAKIHGWGNNKFGQLGLYGFNNVHEPKVIPLPEINTEEALFLSGGLDKDHITSIECGKRHSAFITNKGQVWITGNYRVQPAAEQASDSGRKGRESYDASELTQEDRKAL
jgi:hypothetical protein